MKPAVVLFFLLSLLQNSSLGQTVRFTDTSNVWHMNHSYQVPGHSVTYDYYIWYYDTYAIDGYIYAKLNKANEDSFLIREDTFQKRVYVRFLEPLHAQPDTSELLLYDFTLQQGDTFIMNSHHGHFKHVVDTIINVSINGRVHKQWHMDAITTGGWPYDVIEGIGAIGDPLTPHWPVLFEFDDLVCFRNADIGVWTAPKGTNCLLGISEAPKTAHEITVFPNPAKEQVSIELSNQQFGKGSIILVSDCFGRKILEMHPEPSKRVTQLSTSDWSPGIYNILVRHSDGSFVSKNIVIVK